MHKEVLKLLNKYTVHWQLQTLHKQATKPGQFGLTTNLICSYYFFFFF